MAAALIDNLIFIFTLWMLMGDVDMGGKTSKTEGWGQGHELVLKREVDEILRVVNDSVVAVLLEADDEERQM